VGQSQNMPQSAKRILIFSRILCFEDFLLLNVLFPRTFYVFEFLRFFGKSFFAWDFWVLQRPYNSTLPKVLKRFGSCVWGSQVSAYHTTWKEKTTHTVW